MNDESTRIKFILLTIVLISLACNFPLFEQIKSLFPSRFGSESSYPFNTDGADLTFIPGATFQMGSAPSDTLADLDEIPQHTVTVNDFYIYTHEVTNQMYQTCLEAGGCMGVEVLEAGPTSHFGDSKYNDHPIVGVDWVMAKDYCAWAGGRLPTEAEWELASRGPESLIYPWGVDQPSCDRVNMFGCLVPPDTQEIGQYQLGNSPEGVWDLSGNVWEWVHDWYAEDYYSQSPKNNPIGPYGPVDLDKPKRVARGGGLYSEPDQMRSAARIGVNPYRPFDDVGFRCVAEEVLTFPENYNHGPDRHERVPPDSAEGGGDRAEDPEDSEEDVTWVMSGYASCPDPEGNILVTFEVGSTVAREWYSEIPGGSDWFDRRCEHDPGRGLVFCEGLAPDEILMATSDHFRINFCYLSREWVDTCFYSIDVSIPSECDELTGPGFVHVTPHCIEIDGVMTPVIIINLIDVDEGIDLIRADGDPVTCELLSGEESTFICYDLPGSPGDELTIAIDFVGGGFYVENVVYFDCEGTTQIFPRWALAEVGCQESTDEYYAVIDTFLDEAITSWRLEGVADPWTCDEQPGRVGRWYCNFPIFDWYTELTFCVEIAGLPGEYCETFPDFGSRLPDSCGTPGDDDSPGDGGTFDCSDFSTETECDTHGCDWDQKGSRCTD